MFIVVGGKSNGYGYSAVETLWKQDGDSKLQTGIMRFRHKEMKGILSILGLLGTTRLLSCPVSP